MNNDYDSILTSQDSNVINSTEFYKVGKDLPDYRVSVVERPYAVRRDDYILGGIILLVFAIVLVVRYCSSSIMFRVKDFFTSKRIYSDANVSDSNREVYSTFVLTNITALSLSLIFFNHVTERNMFTAEVGIPYWLIAAGYVVIMLLVYIKAWIYALVNWTFFSYESSVKWQAGYLQLTSFTSFLILPLAIVEIFVNDSSQIVIWCLLFVLIMYELLLFLKMLINFGNKIYAYVLIFLYFCSVELMSTAMMYSILKWVIDCFIDKFLY